LKKGDLGGFLNAVVSKSPLLPPLLKGEISQFTSVLSPYPKGHKQGRGSWWPGICLTMHYTVIDKLDKNYLIEWAQKICDETENMNVWNRLQVLMNTKSVI